MQPVMAHLSREQLVVHLQRLEARLRAQGVTSLALFGSRARRDNKPDSDIDVLIDVDTTRKFSLIDLVTVAQCIEDDTGLPTNIFMRRSLDESFKLEAAKDAVEVFH
jgi:uncharacterized protein